MTAFIILLFVEAQDLTAPWPEALARAAQEALGPSARVLVRSADKDTPGHALAALARQESASAVARVAWVGTRRAEARLEVILAADGSTTAEGLTFEDSDPLAEKGRSLGLVLAALLKREVNAQRDHKSKAIPPSAEAVTPSEPAAASALPRWALDAVAEAGMALGGAGSGAGGTVGLRWLAFQRVGFRLGARARFGQVGEAQGTLMAFSGAAGITVSLLQPGHGGRLGLGVRGDALLLHESITHLSSDDPEPVRQSRLIPGASVLAELRWSLSPAVSLLLAGGPEVAFGTTHVFVRQAEVAELVPIRFAVQAGLLASF